MRTSFRQLSLALTLSLGLQACSNLPSMGGSASGAISGESWVRGAGCLLGAAAAPLAAKALAASEAKRQKLPAAVAAKRERSYLLGFALIGCSAGSALAGTAYSKLSEAGKQARERELMEAASSAKVRTYADPANAKLRGRVSPGPSYAESGNRECRDIEDYLADSGQGEPVVIKMCRTLPNGSFAPVMV